MKSATGGTSVRIKDTIFIFLSLCFILCILNGCSDDEPTTPDQKSKTVPHKNRFGIYELNLSTEDVALIYSSPDEITVPRLSNDGNKFVFSIKIEGDSLANTEICVINIDGTGFKRLTQNNFWDLYPCWSADDSRISFLSYRLTDLDIYLMDSTGDNVSQLFNSGSIDADADWRGQKIVFTTYSQIWSIKDDGTDDKQVSDPPRAGEWGNANLPFGDYDPRLSPNGEKIAFERLEFDSSVHGNYNIFVIDTSGNNETKLTNTNYSQGFASWSHTGNKLVYEIAAINDAGVFDLYEINSDATSNHSITPAYFPSTFLCHSPVYSIDDTKVYFVGEWWE